MLRILGSMVGKSCSVHVQYHKYPYQAHRVYPENNCVWNKNSDSIFKTATELTSKLRVSCQTGWKTIRGEIDEGSEGWRGRWDWRRRAGTRLGGVGCWGRGRVGKDSVFVCLSRVFCRWAAVWKSRKLPSSLLFYSLRSLPLCVFLFLLFGLFLFPSMFLSLSLYPSLAISLSLSFSLALYLKFSWALLAWQNHHRISDQTMKLIQKE